MEGKQKLLAKNTLLLYLRTIVTMCISLYASRVLLDILGVDDFGIYNVVGGMVVMFSVITSSLTTAINRYISYDLGRNETDRLTKVFSTSVSIQLILSVIVLVLGEPIGYWFLNYHMVIPDDRVVAANWVLHCTLISFVVTLISVPYNACIIAHEKMDAFAYVSILEAFLKLGIVFMLVYSPMDKLIYYAILQVVVAAIIRLIYGIYCKRKFVECTYTLTLDKKLFVEMSKFAGWNFFSNTFYIFNTQGVNILINLYFGVAVNAARGIATQVEGAIMTFVKNFITAINPQIIKAYAAGDKSYLNQLIIYGAKYTYFMALIFVVPFVMETEYVMGLWLKEVPKYAVVFVQLSFIYSVIDSMGNTGYFACVATGNMKTYVTRVSLVGFLIFPLTWLAYKLGAPVEYAYVISGIVAATCLVIRLFVLKKLIGLSPMDFIKGAIFPSAIVTVPVFLIAIFIKYQIDCGLIRLLLIILVSEISLATFVYFVGLNKKEQLKVESYLKKIILRNKKC